MLDGANRARPADAEMLGGCARSCAPAASPSSRCRVLLAHSWTLDRGDSGMSEAGRFSPSKVDTSLRWCARSDRTRGQGHGCRCGVLRVLPRHTLRVRRSPFECQAAVPDNVARASSTRSGAAAQPRGVPGPRAGSRRGPGGHPGFGAAASRVAVRGRSCATSLRARAAHSLLAGRLAEEHC